MRHRLPPLAYRPSLFRARRCFPPSAAEFRTGVQRNGNIAKLQAGYLFPEVARRKAAHIARTPSASARMISLGIGDTTEPIPAVIAQAMADRAAGLGTLEGYTGYAGSQGEEALRRGIVAAFYEGMGVVHDDVFVSDGAKCDIARLQMMFGANVSMACQDPSYPAYVDTSVIMGQTGAYDPSSQHYGNITYLRCSPENDFFPDLASAPRTDIIFFCSPNNPTGKAASRAQLEQLVAFARRNGSIVVYDSAYGIYIEDDSPRSIYEIEGAHEVAIETASFSKYAGFTGVRLGWTVVPSNLRYANGHAVRADFSRIANTAFNGASNIAQAGGTACVSWQGLQAMRGLIAFYKENARILKTAFSEAGLETYGGVNAPYVWVRFPGRSSWEVFEEILARTDMVTTPGSGMAEEPVDSAPPVESAPPVQAAPPVDSSPPVESAPPVQAAPAVESVAPAESASPVVSTPLVDSAPPVVSTPLVDSAPPVESASPVVSIPPVESTPPVDSASPAAPSADDSATPLLAEDAGSDAQAQNLTEGSEKLGGEVKSGGEGEGKEAGEKSGGGADGQEEGERPESGGGSAGSGAEVPRSADEIAAISAAVAAATSGSGGTAEGSEVKRGKGGWGGLGSASAKISRVRLEDVAEEGEVQGGEASRLGAASVGEGEKDMRVPPPTPRTPRPGEEGWLARVGRGESWSEALLLPLTAGISDFDVVDPKHASSDALMRWRRMALVRNATRRFRYTADLQQRRDQESKPPTPKVC
ncbi:unnamed protein product [Closterium sp. NIES-54]